MIRELGPHELMLVAGGTCGCRRCREMSELGDDIVDFFKGIYEGIKDGL